MFELFTFKNRKSHERANQFVTFTINHMHYGKITHTDTASSFISNISWKAQQPIPNASTFVYVHKLMVV